MTGPRAELVPAPILLFKVFRPTGGKNKIVANRKRRTVGDEK